MDQLLLFNNTPANSKNAYKHFLTVCENRKGVLDVDTVKGCTLGMGTYPNGGCYGAAELMECYQWSEPNGSELDHVSEEAADIFIYLLNFCDASGIDLIRATKDKIFKNAIKYPIK